MPSGCRDHLGLGDVGLVPAVAGWSGAVVVTVRSGGAGDPLRLSWLGLAAVPLVQSMASPSRYYMGGITP